MKTYITLFAIFTAAFFNQLLAQEHYYYYNGEKFFAPIIGQK